MNEFPDTSTSLIARIKDPSNCAAWSEFEKIYRPVIFRIARAKGLQYADAFDLVQQVLQSVAFAIERFENVEGGPRFRNWLSRVTRNAILKALSRQPKDKGTGGSEMIDVLSEVSEQDLETEALIQLEYRRELFRRAAEEVRGQVLAPTWLAFELSALNDQPIDQVAQSLKMSVGSIYAARSRIMRRIKKVVRELEMDHEEIE